MSDRQPPSPEAPPWQVRATQAMGLGIACTLLLTMALAPWLGESDLFANRLVRALWGIFCVQGIAFMAILLVLTNHVPRPRWRDELGLHPPGWRSLLRAAGWSCLAVLLAIVIGLLVRFGANLLDIELPAEDPILRWLQTSGPFERLFVALLAVVVAPVTEELMFRLVLFRALAWRIGRHGALILTSACFAAIHLLPHAIPPLFVLAVLLQLLYIGSGGLTLPILVHAGFNGIMVTLALIAGAYSGG